MGYNYIAVEGNIGAGKTTLASKMAENFNAKLILEQFEDNSNKKPVQIERVFLFELICNIPFYTIKLSGVPQFHVLP